jgi:hypothetical protein
MKKVVLIGIFAILAISANAQGLFKPVPSNLFAQNLKGLNATQTTSMWIPRISAGIIADQWIVVDKKIQHSAFSKVGLGLSYAHFIQSEGLPYNDYSFNGFLFFPTDGTTKPTLALTVSALKYIQVGIDYDFGVQKVGLLTGITYTF